MCHGSCTCMVEAGLMSSNVLWFLWALLAFNWTIEADWVECEELDS